MDALHEKKQHLENYLRQLGSVAVAFSSGVDSTFLLKVAHDTLGDRAIALTARSHSFPRRELEEATAFCEGEKIAHIVVQTDELAIPGFRENPKNRCYLCKRALFSNMQKTAREHGFLFVAEGSNLDDDGDYRPGMIAIGELGIKSPLRQAQMTKEDIRRLSREMGLPTWDKPSFACLSTRFVYGEPITEEKLSMVERAEQRLFDLGFRQVRVRVHGQLARIEIDRSEFGRIVRPETGAALDEYFRSLGFMYVTLDLGGYQMGSMNRTLDK